MTDGDPLPAKSFRYKRQQADLFPAVSSGFASYKVVHRQVGGGWFERASWKQVIMAQLRRFSCQNDEDGLRDLFGMMWIADVLQRDGINQIDMPRCQRGKSFIGIFPHIDVKECTVIDLLHLLEPVMHFE